LTFLSFCVFDAAFFDVLYYIKAFSGKKQVRENKILPEFCGQRTKADAGVMKVRMTGIKNMLSDEEIIGHLSE
jgi:hypothetical protein